MSAAIEEGGISGRHVWDRLRQLCAYFDEVVVLNTVVKDTVLGVNQDFKDFKDFAACGIVTTADVVLPGDGIPDPQEGEPGVNSVPQAAFEPLLIATQAKAQRWFRDQTGPVKAWYQSWPLPFLTASDVDDPGDSSLVVELILSLPAPAPSLTAQHLSDFKKDSELARRIMWDHVDEVARNVAASPNALAETCQKLSLEIELLAQDRRIAQQTKVARPISALLSAPSPAIVSLLSGTTAAAAVGVSPALGALGGILLGSSVQLRLRKVRAKAISSDEPMTFAYETAALDE